VLPATHPAALTHAERHALLHAGLPPVKRCCLDPRRCFNRLNAAISQGRIHPTTPHGTIPDRLLTAFQPL